MAVSGSHQLLDGGRQLRAPDVRRELCREPFFRALYSEATARQVSADARARVDGVELGLVEMTGEPGDAYVVDLRTLHSGAPNASDRPRLMMTQRFIRADLQAELAEAYGWS